MPVECVWDVIVKYSQDEEEFGVHRTSSVHLNILF